jgi:hypothetical protein
MSKERPETEFERYIKEMPRAELGGLIKEYVAESNHGGWDGFNRHDLTGIRKFFQDVMIYHSNRPNKTNLATRISNVNPVL